MANLQSAKQHIKINKRNRKKNIMWRTQIKQLIKFIKNWENPTKEELQAKLKEAHRILDRVPMQAMHPKKANRVKSRIALMLKELALKA